MLTQIKYFSRELEPDDRKYDFKDEIGRVESGTETENNACCHGWQVVEQCRSYCRGAVIEAQSLIRKTNTTSIAHTIAQNDNI